VQSVTAGIDAIGEVTIRLRQNDRIFAGHSANTDIIVASAQAYVNALNRLYASMQRQDEAGKAVVEKEGAVAIES
jgi:2-isopropylmalate synthase